MSRPRQSSGGYRQKAWDRLRKAPWRGDITSFADQVGCGRAGLGLYLGVLRDHRYLEHVGEDIVLARDTGPRAPSVNSDRSSLHDWNIHPPMDGERLKAIVQASGLSGAAWLDAHGFDKHGTTRLRQMMSGLRPVSAEIERAAMKGG